MKLGFGKLYFNIVETVYRYSYTYTFMSMITIADERRRLCGTSVHHIRSSILFSVARALYTPLKTRDCVNGTSLQVA